MEKKNSILLIVIAVATLLVAVVGATFAYFTASIRDNRSDGTGGAGGTKISTDKVISSIVTANIPGSAGSFTATEVYPGHKEVASLKVEVSGEANSKTGVDFNYNVDLNELGSHVKVSLYRSDTEISIGDADYFGCKKDVRQVPGTISDEVQYFETCETKPIGDLVTTDGTTEAVHILTGGTQQLTLGRDIIDSSAVGSRTVYYYVVVEFMDDNNDQNTYMNKNLSGTITVAPAPGVY